jgi:2'-5' RNA ligase
MTAAERGEPAMIRAFLAVPLPPSLQRDIARLLKELAGALPGVRWTRAETIHLTLRFFGDISVDNLEKVRASMLSVKLSELPFQVDLLGLGAFPDGRRPRVVWIGLTPAEPLHRLYRDCQEALSRVGIAAEPRPFQAHLTIGRFRERGPDLTALLASQAQRQFGRLPVTRLVLYESRLRPGGAQHLPLFTVPLERRDDHLNDRTSKEGTTDD